MKKITKAFLFFLTFVPEILIASKSTPAIQTDAGVAQFLFDTLFHSHPIR